MKHVRTTLGAIAVAVVATGCAGGSRHAISVQAAVPTSTAVTTPDTTLIQPDAVYKDFADYVTNSVLSRGSEVADAKSLQAQLKFPLPLPADATDVAHARVVVGATNGGILVVDAPAPLNQYVISASSPWLGSDGVTEAQWKTNLDGFVTSYGAETTARGASIQVTDLPSTQQAAMFGVEPLQHKVVVTFLHPGKAVVLMEFDETVSRADALAAADAYAAQLKKASS